MASAPGPMASLFLQETVKVHALAADQSWEYFALGAVLAGGAVGLTYAIHNCLSSDETDPLLPKGGKLEANEEGCESGA